MIISLDAIRAQIDNFSLDQLNDQILLRRQLISTMVGTLYQSILQDQIAEIFDLLRNKQ